MQAQNFLQLLPTELKEEVFEKILVNPNITMERIVSKGHSTPERDWYDQEKNEWVMVLQGEAILLWEDGSETMLKAHDYVNIVAHTKHKVKWTTPEKETVWLAIHY